MRIDANGSYVVFGSGKTDSANEGFIGLNPDMEISQGYDGRFWRRETDPNFEWFTRVELCELADYMINLWGQFKRSVEERECG